MNERHAPETTAPEADRIGFFGKVPTHGDFISTGLGRAFQSFLDGWIQAGIQASEQAFGKEWHRHFKAMPPWRFVIERGLWGPTTVVGVVLPSTDRVGRSFPLVIAAHLTSFRDHPRQLCFDENWFIAAEALGETSLTREFEVSSFTAGIKRLRLPHARPPTKNDTPRNAGEPISLWWRPDFDTGQAKGFKTAGAPKTDDFVKLIRDFPAHVAPPATEPLPPKVEPSEPIIAAPVPVQKFSIERSYSTHPGTRLAVNADALLVSESPCILAIADGMGDSIAAVEAAKITTNTLADIAPTDLLDSLVQEVKGKFGRAHGLLQSSYTSNGREAPAASVAALTIVDDAFAVVWAGDARCYLVRDGMMRCLTRDHVEVGLRRTLSRGIGLRAQLMPETVTDNLQSGDRFLLCSYALSRALDERSIAETLIDTPIDQAAEILVQDALIANSRENLSAIVVGIQPE
jgi:type VI secretion system protein ImpM